MLVSRTIHELLVQCLQPYRLVVVQIPRFAFEKFPGSEPLLTTQMKSVGEAMAIGRTFQESFNKALRSLETGHTGWGCEKVCHCWLTFLSSYNF